MQCYYILHQMNKLKTITIELEELYKAVITRIEYLYKLVPYIPTKQLTAFDGLYYHLVLNDLYNSFIKGKQGDDYDYLRFDGYLKGWYDLPKESPSEEGDEVDKVASKLAEEAYKMLQGENLRALTLKSITSHSMQAVENLINFPLLRMEGKWYSHKLNIPSGYYSIDGFSFDLNTGHCATIRQSLSLRSFSKCHNSSEINGIHG